MNHSEPTTKMTRRLVVRSVAWAAIQIWIARFTSLVVFALLARYLVPENFGLVAFAAVWINFVNVVIEQGLGEAIVQKSTLEFDELNAAFWLSTTVGCALSLLAIVLSPAIESAFSMAGLAYVMPYLSLSFVLGAIGSIPLAIMRREFKFKALAARSAVATSISGLVAVVCAVCGMGVWALVVQSGIYSILNCLLAWRAVEWRPRRQFKWSALQGLLSFGSNSVATRVAEFFNTNYPDLIIGAVLGPVALGFYAVGAKVVTILTQMLSQVVLQVAFVTFSRLQHDQKKLNRAFIESSHYAATVAFPAFFGLGLTAGDVIPAFFGNTWLKSAPVITALCLLGCLYSVTYFYGTALAAVGQAGKRTFLVAFRASLTVIGVGALISEGLGAALVGYVVAAYLVAPVGLWMVHRTLMFNLKEYFVSICVPLFASLVMCGVIITVSNSPFVSESSAAVRVLVKVLLGGCVYLTVWSVANLRRVREIVAQFRSAAT